MKDDKPETVAWEISGRDIETADWETKVFECPPPEIEIDVANPLIRRKDVLKLIEEMRKTPKKISEKSGGLDDYAEGQLDILQDLKQKLEGDPD